ncbi:hypothetical protein ANN_24217 [Periplaneta americana]|uniref:Uncharacterized protein n=1 Tax=Periplaneta americana TaxID=6978 RepID=A0ABQ8S2H9_PERAM|nr:hypothetical protein ANN_24217 [Periplaneta americana]
MAGLCVGGNEPSGSLKASKHRSPSIPHLTDTMRPGESPRYIALLPATNDHIPRGPISMTARRRLYIGASPKYGKETEMTMKEKQSSDIDVPGHNAASDIGDNGGDSIIVVILFMQSVILMFLVTGAGDTKWNDEGTVLMS